jgi:signal transduction histidine kinase/DNA-binding NarL/FixJ family response regulator
VVEAAPGLRPSRSRDLDPELADLAARVAGAVDPSDLAQQLALAIGHGAPRSVPVRIWLLDEGQPPKQLARYPSNTRFTAGEADAVLAAAFADRAIRTRSAIVLALRRGETAFGALTVGSRCRVPEDVLLRLAPVVAARVEALRQTELGRSSASAARMDELATDTDAVIAAFAAEAKRLLDHDRLSVYMVTPDGQAFERFAVATSPIVPGESNVIPLEDVGLTYVLKTNRALVSPDLSRDDRLIGHEDSLIAGAGFRGLVSAPLRIGGEPIGVLNFVSYTPGFYAEQDALIAQQIADQVAIFFQNLRLEQRVRLAIERDAAQQERNRLAHELHDTLAQSLAHLLVKLDLLAKESAGQQGRDVVQMRGEVQVMLQELRRSLLRLRPAELERHSLEQAIDALLETLDHGHGVKTSLELIGQVDKLAPEVETTVFRILQEALTNVSKHAAASAVSVTLRVDEGVVLSIVDNGQGFVETGNGFGLQSMRERAEEIGGRLVITSTVNRGTSVNLAVPPRTFGHGRPRSTPTTDHQRRSANVIRVFVVDDHPLFRDSVSRLLELENDLRVIGKAGSAAETAAAVARLRPDVVLMDVQLPDASGIDVLRRLGRLSSPPRVLMLSAFPESGHVVAAMKAGARGYLAKTIEGQSLAAAVRAIANGATIFDASSSASVWTPRRLAELTRREVDVLRLVAAGKTNAEVADELCLAKKTVERIVATAVGKLRARNRAHAVAKAVSLKLIDVDAD